MKQETKKCPYCGEEILAIAKKCKYCGEWLTEEKAEAAPKSMIHCPICSEMIEEGMETCPHCHERVTMLDNHAHEITKPPKVEKVTDANKEDTHSFFNYYLWNPFFRHYFDFKGRLNRKHYWLSILLWFLIFASFFISAEIVEGRDNDWEILPYGIAYIWFFTTIIPLYATATRRLRDVDSEPSWIAWSLLICASPILLIWTCKPSEDEDIRTDGLAPDTPQETKFKTSDIITLVVLIVLNIFFIYKGLHDAPLYNNSDSQIVENNIENKNDGEISMDDNPSVNITVDQKTLEEVKSAYLDFLAKLAEMDEDQIYGQYFLYDITGDDIPELWVEAGTCEEDHAISVFTYKNKLSILHAGQEGNASHSTFYRGNDYILQVSRDMGYAVWNRITYYNKKLQSELVFEENLNESEKDNYTEPSEPAVESYSYDDTEPITSMFDN